MSRLRKHLSYANVTATLALFFALGGGAAYATHLVVRSNDIVNDQVRSVDVRNDDLVAGGLAASDLGAGSVGTSELSTGAFAAPDIAPTSAGGPYAIPNNAIQSSEVSDGALTGTDIDESTLTALDAHETGYSTCDPGSDTFIDCKELKFTLGRPMPILATWTYGFGTDGADPPRGECRVRINGANGVTFQLWSEDDEDYHLGGLPISEVFNLGAGQHTLGFQCQEILPGMSDVVVRQLHIAAIELGSD